MRKIILLLFFVATASAQIVTINPTDPVSSGPAKLNSNFSFLASSKPARWSGAGTPGSIPLSLRGDFYINTLLNTTYQCFRTACSAVGSGNWQLIGQTGIASTTSALRGDGSGNGIAVTGTGSNCVHVDGSSAACPGGTGDVVGPASATDNCVARFDTTTGKLIQNSSFCVDDSGNAATPGTITSGVGSGVAGGYAFTAGTPNTAPTSTVGFQAPASVSTKFLMNLPPAPATGYVYNTGGSDPTVISFVSPTFTTQTDGATITWALGSAIVGNATVTLGGSRTLNLTGLANGGSYVFKIVQDATGSRGLTLGTGCAWKVSGGGAGAITPSTAANSIDVLAFTYDGTNCYANFAKNFN